MTTFLSTKPIGDRMNLIRWLQFFYKLTLFHFKISLPKWMHQLVPYKLSFSNSSPLGLAIIVVGHLK